MPHPVADDTPFTPIATLPSPSRFEVGDDDDGISVVRIALGYVGTLVLTLASALAISGYAPHVMTTVAGI